MIHPSYTELMAVINSEVEEGEQPLVQSRYSIVKATANRAKEIIDARSVEEKIAKARIEASNKEKEKEKDKDKVEEKRISKEDERKLQVGTPLVRCSEKSHYQSQLKNSTKVRLRFLEVQTRILHYN
jgi:flagellar biosynthesis component FlhA